MLKKNIMMMQITQIYYIVFEMLVVLPYSPICCT